MCFAENPHGIATSNSVFVRQSILNNFKVSFCLFMFSELFIELSNLICRRSLQKPKQLRRANPSHSRVMVLMAGLSPQSFGWFRWIKDNSLGFKSWTFTFFICWLLKVSRLAGFCIFVSTSYWSNYRIDNVQFRSRMESTIFHFQEWINRLNTIGLFPHFQFLDCSKIHLFSESLFWSLMYNC